ncbi:MAG: diphosphomevalonate decarboxylase [Nitrososphaera sp.]
MISTAVSHPNKAIVIYWGNSDDELNLPSRTSLSMTLQGVERPLDYTATLQTLTGLDRDRVIIDGQEDKGEIYSDLVGHLDAMRKLTHFKQKLIVSTKTTFPIGSGLAGSAAAASALAEAFAGLVKDELGKEKISLLARRGSGSAARSVLGGFVKLATGSDEQSIAIQISDENHWDLRNVIAVVDPGLKKIKSRDGMRMSTRTCPPDIYSGFVAAADDHVQDAQDAILSRDLAKIGEVYEFDNAFFREVCMNTEPVLDYWSKSTADVFNMVTELRSEGMAIYAGTDAGPNVHILCEPRDTAKLVSSLGKLQGVREIIHAGPGGPSLRSDRHLA